jgi:hypothetical protein
MIQEKNIDFDIDSSIVEKKGLVSRNNIVSIYAEFLHGRKKRELFLLHEFVLFGTLSQTTNVDKKI